MDTLNNYTDAEARIRMEDVVKVLDEIGVPEMDTPAQRVRALAEQLATRLVTSKRVLDVATRARADLAFANTVEAAKWKPFPDCAPPTDRDVLVSPGGSKQSVARWDAAVGRFYTSSGTRVRIPDVAWWRELVGGPEDSECGH